MSPWNVVEAQWAMEVSRSKVSPSDRRAAEAAWAAIPPSLHPGWIPVLQRVPLFAALSKRHLRRVARLAEMRRFPKGTVVVKAGSRGDAMYVILDGTAQVETPAGHKQKLEGGAHFGELALLDGAPRAADVVATSTVTLAKIPRSGFKNLLQDEPTMAFGLANGLVAIIRDMEKQ